MLMLDGRIIIYLIVLKGDNDSGSQPASGDAIKKDTDGKSEDGNKPIDTAEDISAVKAEGPGEEASLSAQVQVFLLIRTKFEVILEHFCY